MFGFFKKRPSELPNFQYLDNYANKNKYFVRTMQWDWLDNRMIHLIDNKAPRMITMDEWPQQIYLDADGQKTISEYIIWMANQYSSGQAPAALDKEMIEMIEDLIHDGNIIQLKEEMTTLPYYLDLPISKQDTEKAYKMKIQDGYIKEG